MFGTLWQHLACLKFIVHLNSHLKFVVGKIFLCFWKKSLTLTKAALFDQKYSKNSNIVNYYYNLNELFSIWIYFALS